MRSSCLLDFMQRRYCQSHLSARIVNRLSGTLFSGSFGFEDVASASTIADALGMNIDTFLRGPLGCDATRRETDIEIKF